MFPNLRKCLPLLPGNTFDRKPGCTRFHKSHQFDFYNNVGMTTEPTRAGIGGGPLPYHRPPSRSAILPEGEAPALPAWVAFDKQVLRFVGYFQEAVHDSRVENFRVRSCEVLFFLEDDTVRVDEPRMDNSGIPQGTLIRRHRIRKPPPRDRSFFSLEDFNVGVDVELYGRRIRLVCCDTFTRNFLQKLGIAVGDNTAPPEDLYTKHRAKLEERLQPLKPIFKVDTLGQFLKHDGHVLRFWGYWDQEGHGGGLREMVLHYFLGDDTIEIREVIRPNSGRDAFPVFVRRDVLPKSVMAAGWPGDKAKVTMLNIFHTLSIQDRAALIAVAPEKYYRDCDLRIGSHVNAWGRKIVLTHCDEFTKEFYRQKYGVKDFTPLPLPHSNACEVLQRELPPYNGFGTEEDSRANCLDMVAKPPKKDPHMFYLLGREGWDSKVLRFLARLVAQHPVNIERRFVLSFFLSDDTVAIYEPAVVNSGLAGGTFLHRRRVLKPGQDLMTNKSWLHFTPSDCYVGAILEIDSFRFELLNADEYTFTYMEKNCLKFPHSNWKVVLEHIRNSLGEVSYFDLATTFNRDDPEGTGLTYYERFRDVLLTATNNALSEHEVMTMARRSAAPKKDLFITLEALQAVAQTELRKNLFNDFDGFLRSFQVDDKDNCGLVERHVLRGICRGQPLPLHADLQDRIVDLFPAADETNNLICYDKFVNFLNWAVCPTEVAAPIDYKRYLRKPEAPEQKGVHMVRYNDFLSELGYEEPVIIPKPGRQHDVYQIRGEKEECEYGAGERWKARMLLDPSLRCTEEKVETGPSISVPDGPEGGEKLRPEPQEPEEDILAACKVPRCVDSILAASDKPTVCFDEKLAAAKDFGCTGANVVACKETKFADDSQIARKEMTFAEDVRAAVKDPRCPC